jgi:tetratricopeptide (TPR) repeat protein
LNRAVEEIKQAVFIDSENFMAQYTKGRLLFKSESYEDCPDPLENAKRLKPDSPQVISLLARSYALLGVNDKAIKNYVALAKMKEYSEQPEVYNELGVLFYEKKDYPRAARFFKKALSLNANSPTVNLNLAVLCDKLCFSSEDVKNRDGYARIAEKYYMRYLKLIDGNPSLLNSQKTVILRIKKLRSLASKNKNQLRPQ